MVFDAAPDRDLPRHFDRCVDPFGTSESGDFRGTRRRGADRVSWRRRDASAD